MQTATDKESKTQLQLSSLFVCKFTYLQSVPLPNEQGLRQADVACSGSGLQCLNIKRIYSPDIKLNRMISIKSNRNQPHVVTAASRLSMFQKNRSRNILTESVFLSAVSWLTCHLHKTEALLFHSELQKQKHLAAGLNADNQLADDNMPRNRTSKSMDLCKYTHTYAQALSSESITGCVCGAPTYKPSCCSNHHTRTSVIIDSDSTHIRPEPWSHALISTCLCRDTWPSPIIPRLRGLDPPISYALGAFQWTAWMHRLVCVCVCSVCSVCEWMKSTGSPISGLVVCVEKNGLISTY